MMTNGSETQQDAEAEFLERVLALRHQHEDLRACARSLVAQGERSGFALPGFLRGIAGMSAPVPRGNTTAVVPAMPPPVPEPLGLGEALMWVPVSSSAASVRNIILGILTEQQPPMPVSELHARFCKYRDVSPGTLANAGTALSRDEEIIRDPETGWRRAPSITSPVLADGYLWGTFDQFGKQEIAWFRRECIKHLLRVLGGLMQSQIVERLRALEWVPGPKEKDTVKMDLEALRQDGVVARAGHTKKWVLKDQEAST